MTAPEAPDAEGPSYAATLAELEAIVAELEGDAVDVDHLSTRVQRASELIAILRQRIGTARMDVARVVASLEAPDVP
ncbi:MAG: exodeoxyribonuclease VII small subunit [Acidimicrobiia bacterium]|nr:exodeoxyribonuclease VII small subunit [Acidimicrobiia bacterium]